MYQKSCLSAVKHREQAKSRMWTPLLRNICYGGAQTSNRLFKQYNEISSTSTFYLALIIKILQDLHKTVMLKKSQKH